MKAAEDNINESVQVNGLVPTETKQISPRNNRKWSRAHDAALRSVRVLDGRAGVSGLFEKHGDKGEKVGQGEDFFFRENQ